MFVCVSACVWATTEYLFIYKFTSIHIIFILLLLLLSFFTLSHLTCFSKKKMILSNPWLLVLPFFSLRFCFCCLCRRTSDWGMDCFSFSVRLGCVITSMKNVYQISGCLFPPHFVLLKEEKSRCGCGVLICALCYSNFNLISELICWKKNKHTHKRRK